MASFASRPVGYITLHYITLRPKGKPDRTRLNEIPMSGGQGRRAAAEAYGRPLYFLIAFA